MDRYRSAARGLGTNGPILFLACVCVAQEHHHLKIAEKLAIPHHIRHAYEYPQLNLGAAVRPAVNSNSGFQRQPSSFSQPDPFNQPSAPSSFGGQPPAPSSFGGQPLGFRSGSSQPVRQTRFFNLYTQSNRPEFGLSRRQS
ncbi:hypothetical protein TNCT_473441 [Trichonephila clavata]|uniref:Uncharacterized protein n=1 Tax=Trichonephila clavata TaxID=2740835 RepID=A0A8X6GMH5_TRICU|nr:hypothetical protein TNCT_473441 [Trichonephila clavata]